MQLEVAEITVKLAHYWKLLCLSRIPVSKLFVVAVSLPSHRHLPLSNIVKLVNLEGLFVNIYEL